MINFLSTILTLSLIIGCSGGRNSPGTPTSPGEGQNPKIPISVEQLEGWWITGCQGYDTNKSFRTILMFDTVSVPRFLEQTVEFYSNASCLNPSSHLILIQSAFELSPEFYGNGQKINLILEAQYAYISGQEDSDQLNQLRACGITNWDDIEFFDVIGRDCKDSHLPFGKIFSNNDVLLSIISINNENLFIGDLSSKDGSSEENRPIELDSVHFIRD